MKGIIWITCDDDYKNQCDRYSEPNFFMTDEKIIQFIKKQLMYLIEDYYGNDECETIKNNLKSLLTINELDDFRYKYLEGNYIHCKVNWIIFNVKENEDDV